MGLYIAEQFGEEVRSIIILLLFVLYWIMNVFFLCMFIKSFIAGLFQIYHLLVFVCAVSDYKLTIESVVTRSNWL